MKNILEYTEKELQDIIKNLNMPSFKGKSLFKWVYDKGIFDFDKMTDFSLKEREILKNEFLQIEPVYAKKFVSKIDGTKKYAFNFNDNIVEAVYIPENDRRTVCLSSQTGCNLGCVFCATSRFNGENLETSQIIQQLVSIINDNEDRISNIVFMGMGEPLLNLDNVLKAIGIINSQNGIKIGARKITVSTAGIVPGIKSLIDFPLQIKLAVSLNSAIQSKREMIMPIAKTYKLDSLKKTLLKYQKAKNKTMTFEYILFPGFNDGKKDIDELLDYLKDFDFKINVIPYNNIKIEEKEIGFTLREPNDNEINNFIKKLSVFKNSVMLRNSKGKDIKGACGQLRRELDFSSC